MKSDLIAVELSASQWIVVLGLLEAATQDHVVPRLREIQEAKIAPAGLLPEEVAALGGTLVARARIADVLVKEGVMKPEAGPAIGMEMLEGLVAKRKASS